MFKEIIKSTVRPVLTPFRPGNILMIHLGRSGSTVLANLIKEHPRVYWGAELYNRSFMEWVKSNNGKEVIGKMPDDAISLLRADMRHALHRYYGFEIKPFHFRLIGYEARDFIQHLDDMGFTHFIILDRKNRLRKIVSSVIAHQDRSRYHIKEGKKLEVKKVHIDTRKVEIDFDSKPLLDYLTDFDRQIKVIRELLKDRKVLEINYEEHIMNDPKVAYLKVCDFVGLKPKKVDVNLRRTNPYPVKEMIDNLDEVESVLSGTPYRWMLDE